MEKTAFSGNEDWRTEMEITRSPKSNVFRF
jgi:hypothetical protein